MLAMYLFILFGLRSAGDNCLVRVLGGLVVAMAQVT